MFETAVTILIFIAVISLTALLFGGWLVVMVARALVRLVMAPFQTTDVPMLPTAAATDTAADTAQCAHDRCRAVNPATASFCRRCGMPIRAAQRVPVRRVAMW